MNDYTKKDILKSLLKVGLKKKDIIFVNPELFKFGFMEDINDKDDYYKTFLNVILDIIGPNGTLMTNTYTFQTLRYKEKFIYENTKSSSGTFSEIVRKNVNSIRSEHPVFSVSAIGKYKKYLCKKNSRHNYGYGSPYQRFLKLNGKILNLAIEPALNPFLHVSEFMMGVPYYYNKLTKVQYYKNKNKVSKDYISSVRYLDFDLSYDIKKINKEIKKKLKIKKVKLGKAAIYLFNSKNYLKVALNMLNKNTFAFVKKIKFNKKDYPLK
jgi:aminoglycoside 3-N-acetyltransferase